jgi:hypothetical protein
LRIRFISGPPYEEEEKHSMAYALASLIEIKNRDITGHEFHLPLCDLLQDRGCRKADSNEYEQ